MSILGVPQTWSHSEGPLALEHDVTLCDLDGVVYVGRSAVPGAVAALAQARASGMRLGYVTNNAARPPEVVAEHLTKLGIPCQASDVVTSAQAGARVLAELVPAGSKVLYIGGPGVPAALEQRGFVAVSSIDDDPVALIQGYGRNVGWEQLAHGSYALFRGLPWVATNTDRTIPTPRGKALGNGSMVAALIHATGASPIVAGKPEPPLMLESVERLAASRPLVVGDRLDTDIEGGNRSGIPGLLVLTGVSSWTDLLGAPARLRPSYLAHDLGGLLSPHPEVQCQTEAGNIVATCGLAQARATVDLGANGDNDWSTWPTVDPAGDRGLDQVRALVALSWHAADNEVVLRDVQVRTRSRWRR